MPEPQLEQLFSALWPSLEKQFAAIPKPSNAVKRTRSQSDVLEELVGSVRNVEMRIRDSDGEFERGKKRKFRRHPELLLDMINFSSKRKDDPLRYIILLV